MDLVEKRVYGMDLVEVQEDQMIDRGRVDQDVGPGTTIVIINQIPMISFNGFVNSKFKGERQA